jgi:hypothetical protein
MRCDGWSLARPLCARGKSEHRKAACLAKAGEFGAKAPDDGKYHRKHTAPHHFESRTWRRPQSSGRDLKWCGARLKRRGKSPPDLRVSGVAGETPCGARQNRGIGRLPDFFRASGKMKLRVLVAPRTHFGAGPVTQMRGVWLDPKWCGASGKPNEINDRHSRKREQNSAYVTKRGSPGNPGRASIESLKSKTVCR